LCAWQGRVGKAKIITLLSLHTELGNWVDYCSSAVVAPIEEGVWGDLVKSENLLNVSKYYSVEYK
jgi:hypothetical protein